MEGSLFTMDDLLASFGSVEVTPHPNTPHAEHPRFALYKAKVSGSCQEERRKRVLEARKEARYDLLSHLRSIEETDVSQGESSDDMEYDQVQECYRRPKKYKDFLMLSEWLVDVPNNFATYLTVPCPVGKRSLVVSARGRTRSYTKSGYQVNQFPSLLPGGSRRNNNMGYALLDCIWSEINKTFYVIDVMCWLNQPVIECDTFFRFEWLKSRLEEEAVGIGEISKYNPMRFERLPYYESSPESLSKLFGEGGQLPFPVELDGILFYNRDTHYTHGPTPLVGWLKAYMLPEILGVPVAEKYEKERPAKYISLPKHIEYAKELKKDRKEKMDVTPGKDKRLKSTPTSENVEEEMESVTS
ncbi:snurportin-1 isoform X1 [Macrobrachium rosenbergii]|uniref:snurportin-1 isoform X1 n=2 Tax=Macrobrachium rosenbergii TaxID=79674 RepID=UPI0034D6EA05